MMRMLALSLISRWQLCSLPLLPCVTLQIQLPSPTAQTDEARKFRAYLDADWKRWMEEYPEVATGVGYPGQNDRWSDDSPAGIERAQEASRREPRAPESDSRDALPEDEQAQLRSVSRNCSRRRKKACSTATIRFRSAFVVPRSLWMPHHQMGGVQQGAADTLESTPHHNVAEYEIILAADEALPASVASSNALAARRSEARLHAAKDYPARSCRSRSPI